MTIDSEEKFNSLILSEEKPPAPQPSFDAIKTQMEKTGFWMRPLFWIEERLIYQEELFGIKLRTIGRSFQRNLTSLLFQDIAEAYKHSQIFSAASIGTAGCGKSSLMLALAVQCQLTRMKLEGLSEPPQIITAIGRNDTMKSLSELQPGMVFFEDEDPFTAGTDSQITTHAIRNVQEIVMRFNKVPYLTAAVNLKGGKMAKNIFICYLEPTSKRESDRTTYCRLYSGRTLLPLGHINIRILPSDHPVQMRHDKKEKEYKWKMLSNRGYESIGLDPQELDRRSKILYKYATGISHFVFNKLTRSQKNRLRRFRIERLKTAMRKLAYELPGSEDQHKRVVDETWAKIDQMKIKIELEIEEHKKRDRKKKEKERELKRQQKEEEKQRLREEKERLKRERKEIEQQEIEYQKKEVIPELIQECIDTYQGKKFRPIQIKVFFEERGIHKSNLNYCLAKVLDEISENEKKLEVVDSDSASVSGEEHFSYRLDSKSDDEGILHLIYQKMREIFPKINKSRLKEKHLEAWYDYYVLAKPARKLLSKYNIKAASNFENKYEDWGWIAIIEQEILGYAAELAVNEKYFPGYKHQGQKEKADLINDDKHWIEIKIRSENKLPKWDDFSLEEKSLLKQDYPGLYIMHVHSRGKPMKIYRYIIEKAKS